MSRFRWWKATHGHGDHYYWNTQLRKANAKVIRAQAQYEVVVAQEKTRWS